MCSLDQRTAAQDVKAKERELREKQVQARPCYESACEVLVSVCEPSLARDSVRIQAFMILRFVCPPSSVPRSGRKGSVRRPWPNAIPWRTCSSWPKARRRLPPRVRVEPLDYATRSGCCGRVLQEQQSNGN